MNTSAKSDSGYKRAYVPTSAIAQQACCDEEHLIVQLTDGRKLTVPLIWFPRLHNATTAQREKPEIASGGRALYWPELDEDISIAGLLAGADRQSA